MKRIQFRLTAYTDAAGKKNDVPPLYGNEDNFFVDADLSNEEQGEFTTDHRQMLFDYGSLLVVADGMGGMNAGEVASGIAIRTVRSFFTHEKLTHDIVATSQSRERYMERVVTEADTAIKTHARENKECEGMGSTIILVWICDGYASVTWCGDSRAYLFREASGIVQLSKDHSYVQSLVDDGKITADEAFDHPYGNIITRSLGDPEKRAQADSRTVSLFRGDIVLVCSDGLSGVVRDRRTYGPDGRLREEPGLEELIRANRASMQQCREALWRAAEQADWYDNVTAILFEVTDGEIPPAGAAAANALPPNDDRKYFVFRLRKRTCLYTLATLIILGLVACGVLFGLRHHKKDGTEWQQKKDEIELMNRIDTLSGAGADSLRKVIRTNPEIDATKVGASIDSLLQPGKSAPSEQPSVIKQIKPKNITPSTGQPGVSEGTGKEEEDSEGLTPVNTGQNNQTSTITEA